MLDQNTTTLLAALTGGLLSALGGFLANLYTQTSSDRMQKKKEIRNILEQIYKRTQSINSAYFLLSYDIPIEEIDKKIQEIRNNLAEMESMVDLYLSPLKQDFIEYQDLIKIDV